MKGPGKGALCLSSSLFKPLQEDCTVYIANEAGNPNHCGAAHCCTTPLRGVSGSSFKVIRTYPAIAQRLPSNTDRTRNARAPASTRKSSQVKDYSPGNMEQVSSRGHEASPQSGLGVG